MEIFKMQHQIAAKQIDLIERYIEFVKEMEVYKNRLNGEISQTDLLVNRILDSSKHLEDNQVINEQRELYKRILIKKHAQKRNSSNQLFKNIFMCDMNANDVEERVRNFLGKNLQLNEEEEIIEHIIELIERDKYESK
jgi:hypothetical protein